MNSIAPHGPPVQSLPGQPPTGGGPKDDTSFGDLLTGGSSKAPPSPIEDHSPPPNPDEAEADDLSGAPLPRPMRWKGGKGPASPGPDAATGVPLPPAQTDLRAMMPGVTLSADWVRAIPAAESSEGVAAATGLQETAASDAPTGGGGVGGVSFVDQPLTSYTTAGPVGLLRTASAVVTGGSEEALGVMPLDGQAASGQGSGASRASAFPSRSLGTRGAGEGEEAEQGSPASLANAFPSATRERGSGSVFTGTIQERGKGGPGAEEAILPVKQAPVDGGEPIPEPSSTPSPDAASTVRIIPTDTAPAPTTGGNPPASATDNRIELTDSFRAEEAKIAAAAENVAPPSRDARFIAVQTAANKGITKHNVPDGTGVAKDASVVTTTLPETEGKAEASPLPKRGGSATGLASSPGRAGTGAAQGREVTPGIVVAGVADTGATPSQIAAIPVPEPTAARHAAKVETMLQNALSAGESLRPNGHEQMEMRVRLGGGSEDVTIRLQVANDRMQVTFQTNSPEMRKALEHGWEQFSASASQSSTLGLAAPRFETGPASGVQQGMQADAQAFSFNQQNSRRQDSRDALPDDGMIPAGSNRASVSTDTARPITANPSTGRRWTGWA